MPNYSAKAPKTQDKNDRDPYALSVLTHRRNTLTATYTQDAQGQVTKSKAPAFSTFFDHSAVRAADIYAFAEVLANLATRPKSCIIRGAVKPDLGEDSNSILRDGRVRKVCHDRAPSEDYQGHKAAFDEVDRIFALGDSDGVVLPFDVNPKDPTDLDRAAQYLLKVHGLTGGSCVVQWSSSAFLTDAAEIAPHKAKAHIWFAFDKPVCSAALKEWIKSRKMNQCTEETEDAGFDGEGDDAQLDPTLAQCVQLHYTANPVFVGDLRDPLAWRVKVFQGGRDALDAEAMGLYDNAEAQRRAQEAQRNREADEAQRAKEAKQKQELATRRLGKGYTITTDRAETARRLFREKLETTDRKNRHDYIKYVSFVGFGLAKGDNGISEGEIVDAIRTEAQALFASEPARFDDEMTRCVPQYRDAATPRTVSTGRSRIVASNASEASEETSEASEASEASNASEETSNASEASETPKKTRREKRKAGAILRKFLKKKPVAVRDDGYLPNVSLVAGVTVLAASMGAGKTYQIGRLAAQYRRVLVVAHRRMLLRGLLKLNKALAESGCEDRFVNYEDAPKDAPIKANKLLVCIDSIHRVDRQPFDLVVVDEDTQTIPQIFKDKEAQRWGVSNYQKFDAFRFFVCSAAKVLLCDAHHDQSCLDAVMKLTPPNTTAEVVTHNRRFAHTDVIAYETRDDAEAGIAKELERGKRIAVGFTQKAKAEDFRALVEKRQPELKILSLLGGAKEEHEIAAVADPSLWAGYDLVIFTGAAGAGVSCDVDHFDAVGIVADHVRGVGYNEILQMTARVRSPKTPTLHLFVHESTQEAPRTAEEHAQSALDKGAIVAGQVKTFWNAEEKRVERRALDQDAVDFWAAMAAMDDQRNYRQAVKVFSWLRSVGCRFSIGGNVAKEEKMAAREDKQKARQERIELLCVGAAFAHKKPLACFEEKELDDQGEQEKLRSELAELYGIAPPPMLIESASSDGIAATLARFDALGGEEMKESAQSMKQEATKFLEVAQRHLKGDLLRQVSTLAQAVTFDLDPKHYAEKDLRKLTRDGGTLLLSSVDATDHYTKAHLARDLARVVCAAYPETVETLHALQRQGCEGDPPPFFLCTNKNNKGVVDHASLAESAGFQSALRNLFTPTTEGDEEHIRAYHRQRWALLKARGITSNQEDLEILGRVLSCFGFKQERKRQRTDEGLKSSYVLSMRSVVDQHDLAVASVRRFRDRKPWIHRPQEAVTGQADLLDQSPSHRTITEPSQIHHTEPSQIHHTEPSQIHHTEPSQIHHTEPSQIHHPSPSPSILNAFAGEALAWCGLDDSASFEAKATAFLRLEGAEGVAKLALQAGRLGQDTHAILSRLDAICGTVAGYLGADISALIPYTQRLFMASPSM